MSHPRWTLALDAALSRTLHRSKIRGHRPYSIETGFDCVSLGFIEFHRFFLVFIGFRWILLRFTGFYQVYLGLIRFNCVSMGFGFTGCD